MVVKDNFKFRDKINGILLLCAATIVCSNNILAQAYTTLTFTGRSSLTQEYIPLHHIEISNATQHWEEGLYYPDTILQFGGVGIEEYSASGSALLLQNVPNPFDGITDFTLQLSQSMQVLLEVYNVEGQKIMGYSGHFPMGSHLFRATLSSPQTYLLSANTEGGRMSIKMINTGVGENNGLIYLGAIPLSEAGVLKVNGGKGMTPLPFMLGDEMVFLGHFYFNGNDYVSHTVQQRQWGSENITLFFDISSPFVQTSSATNVEYYSAICGGNVISEGGMNVIDRGVCWNTTGTPTLVDSHISEGNGAGAFSCCLTGLSENTTYYVRAYATNGLQTVYGDEETFNTILLEPPIVSTSAISNVSYYSASGGGDVTDGAYVTARGVCWSTSHSPTVLDSHTTNDGGIGVFTSSITGLTDNTTYYVRAYATNSAGTSYGEEVSFTTLEAVTPTVNTVAVSNIGFYSASCGGNVTSDGGAPVFARGVCWSTSPNPVVSENHTTNGSGTGSFVSDLTNLSSNTTYYVRAYATNSVGTGYGAEVNFTTLYMPEGDAQPCPDAATVTDIDGNVYNTVKIGSQCWMKENLKTTKYADGANIPHGSTSSIVANWYYPNNNSSNKPTYGLLYNWKAVMRNNSSSSSNPSGIQGVCPTGWHVPSAAEWTQLVNYVGSQNVYLCNASFIAKALASTIGWNSSNYDMCEVGYNPSSNNVTGFNAMPAGIYDMDNHYSDFGNKAYFWSATEYVSWCSNSVSLWHSSPNVITAGEVASQGFSVRCVLNESQVYNPPTVTTSSVTITSSTTATCGGNVTNTGGADVTERGVCWGTNPNPTVSGSYMTNSSGVGSFTSGLTGLSLSTTYYVRAYATNSVGTAYGEEVSFSIAIPSGDAQPCPGVATLTDRDGNVYNTVKIGSQCWMKENLKTTKYADGTSIPQGTGSSDVTGYWYYPGRNSSNMSTYGLLYNWKAVMRNSASSSSNPSGVQGICPTGWHVPSDAEWTQLVDYVGSHICYVCEYAETDNSSIAKSLAATTGWLDYSDYYSCAAGSMQGNNATGFSASPAGNDLYSDYSFTRWAYFNSSTESSSDSFWVYDLYYGYDYVNRGTTSKSRIGSVRCVRN